MVEDGINPNGRDEDGEDDDGEGAEPEPEPPSARGDADDPEEQEQQRRHDKEGEAEGLELIEGPTGPGLDGEPVGALDVLAVDVEWKRDQGEKDDGDGEKDKSLEPAVVGDALGPVAQGGGPAPGEDEQQDEDGPRSASEGEEGAQAGEGDGLGEQRGGQCVRCWPHGLTLRGRCYAHGCWPHGHRLGECDGLKGCQGEEAGEG